MEKTPPGVGFGLDSLIESAPQPSPSGQLNERDQSRKRRALRLIGGALIALALYIVVQAADTLIAAQPHITRPSASPGRP